MRWMTLILSIVVIVGITALVGCGAEEPNLGTTGAVINLELEESNPAPIVVEEPNPMPIVVKESNPVPVVIIDIGTIGVGIPETGYNTNMQLALDGLYPGFSGSIPITIINGMDHDRIIRITIEPVPGGIPKSMNTALSRCFPSGITVEVLPTEYLSWITLSESDVHITAGESKDVIVTISIPEDTDYVDKYAQFMLFSHDRTGVDYTIFRYEILCLLNITSEY